MGRSKSAQPLTATEKQANELAGKLTHSLRTGWGWMALEVALPICWLLVHPIMAFIKGTPLDGDLFHGGSLMISAVLFFQTASVIDETSRVSREIGGWHVETAEVAKLQNALGAICILATFPVHAAFTKNAFGLPSTSQGLCKEHVILISALAGALLIAGLFQFVCRYASALKIVRTVKGGKA